MNRPGALLDAGPLVALLDRTDRNHERAKGLAATCARRGGAPAVKGRRRCTSRGHRAGSPGGFAIALRVDEHWLQIEQMLKKYRDVPASIADVCFAEIWQEPRILTFDDDFRVYRWDRHRRFDILVTPFEAQSARIRWSP